MRRTIAGIGALLFGFTTGVLLQGGFAATTWYGPIAVQPNVPIITTPQATFSLPPPNVLNTPLLGQEITDGTRFVGLSVPYKPVSPDKSGLVIALSPNPSLQCPFTANINQTASTTVITNPGGAFIHICTDKLISATQQGLTLAEGTGTACATNPTYVDGGSGGTNQVLANGGWAENSDRIITPMQKAGDNWCVLQSGSGNVSGKIVYGVFAQ